MKFFGKSTAHQGQSKQLNFDYKDPLTLYGFIDGGKITPARVTNLSHTRQKALCNAIKKARSIGLLPSCHQTFDDFSRPEPVSPKPFNYK